MKTALSILLVAVCFVPLRALRQGAAPERASQAELDVLITSHVEPYCKSIKGDEQAFRLATSPYGPLDLQVGNARTLSETFGWKAFYLGTVVAAAGVEVSDLDTVKCGGGSTEERKSTLVKKLPEISALVRAFHDAPQLNILASWGISDAYRINNVFHTASKTREALPSTIMGFVPSGKWRELKNTDQYLAEIKLSNKDLVALIDRIKELNLAALVRHKEGYIKVVFCGIGNNEAGLIFHPDFFKKPGPGPMVISDSFNAEYPALSVILPGVIYYEKYAY